MMQKIYGAWFLVWAAWRELVSPRRSPLRTWCLLYCAKASINVWTEILGHQLVQDAGNRCCVLAYVAAAATQTMPWTSF